MSQPEVASGVTTLGLADVGTTLLMLFLVLGLIFALAWMAKKMRLGLPKSQGNMQVIQQMSLGQKERLVVVKAGKDNLLLGVTSSQISYIKTLGDDFDEESEITSKQTE
ncbi:MULTISPECIES: flagellar biosynthetic protein FliO [Gammaproteobacteria]|uniref:flagellar biosynthetic protein FliO n=1 Tax=Gammaproteobacteria TaxID=1236 RepID=UPI000DCFE730|nr:MULTISPECIES: flagellar biosynthetic protein FliO [Gammaproteobacteria]RTE85452.1 flagellar biosynthetic protein FliO [Aliidiomarina sp. B3213]TCZ89419.1 flagellar biosynthetic protein FliO [Lysobacter sp. N42]